MLRVVGRDAARIAVVTAMLVFAWGGPAASADDLVAFNQQMVELHGQGRYQEAVAIGERALALAERTLGADNGDALTIVNNLGFLYQQQGRYSEAERLTQRAVAGRERISGADDPETLTAVTWPRESVAMCRRFTQKYSCRQGAAPLAGQAMPCPLCA